MPWSKEKLSQWRKDNRGLVNASKKSYYDSHPEYRAKALAAATEHRFMKVYGITVAQYNELFNKQLGRCALCGTQPTNTRKLCVDHDHVTGRVRGLLCIQCNSALGKLGDSVAGLLRAVRYLEG